MGVSGRNHFASVNEELFLSVGVVLWAVEYLTTVTSHLNNIHTVYFLIVSVSFFSLLSLYHKSKSAPER